MIKKLCPACGLVIKRGQGLCEECNAKMAKKRNKAYNSVLRNKDHDAIYADPRWRKIKPIVHLRDKGKCRVCFENKVMKNLQMVHHIVEPEEDVSKAFDVTNLISLCESCHQKIHAAYRNGQKEETVRILQMLTEKPIKI